MPPNAAVNAANAGRSYYRRARAAENSSAPPKDHMPGFLRALLLAVAGIFDAIKFACLCIIFLAPFIVGIGATLVTQGFLEQHLGKSWGDSVASLVGIGAGVATAAVQFTQPEIDGIVEGVGVMLAWCVAVFACVLLTFLLAFAGRAELLDPPIFLNLTMMYLTSLVPLVDGAPSLFYGTWRITGEMKRLDAERWAKWEAQERASTASRQQRAAQIENAWAVARGENLAEALEEEPLFAPERPERKSPVLAPTPNYAAA